MDFWDRLKEEIRKSNTTQEWVASHNNISFGTFRKWLSRKTMPNADDAVKIAKSLKITVEELVEGDAGREYVMKWAERHGAHPPPRVQAIIDDLLAVSDECYDGVRALLAAAAKKARDLEPNPQAENHGS